MMDTPSRVTAEARSRCARYWRKRLTAPAAPSRPPAQLAGRAWIAENFSFGSEPTSVTFDE